MFLNFQQLRIIISERTKDIFLYSKRSKIELTPSPLIPVLIVIGSHCIFSRKESNSWQKTQNARCIKYIGILELSKYLTGQAVVPFPLRDVS